MCLPVRGVKRGWWQAVNEPDSVFDLLVRSWGSLQSFSKTVKAEEVDLREDVDMDDARRHILLFSADLYNRRRRHSSLGYGPPAEFAARYTAAQR
nr:integrase core domain-containing protein [Deinococcus sp. HSC-46F16]